MTSVPQAPGAPAIYLDKQEDFDDTHSLRAFHVRIKVLTEGGKDRATVEIPFFRGQTSWLLYDVAGRTIHSDGSVTLFTGKPYDKFVVSADGFKFQERVFTLPAVEVGSILEYRYQLDYGRAYYSPNWIIQSDLFTRKAHYSWRPGYRAAGWVPILPQGAKVVESLSGYTSLLQLDIQNVPPLPKEDDMPPIDQLGYRVLFYFSTYKTGAEFWLNVGKSWSDARNEFIGPHSQVKSRVKDLIQPGDSEEEKLRRIYTLVTSFENTELSRERTAQEDKAEGAKLVKTGDEVLVNARGNANQLTDLFVGMARAAGLKAYLMGVPDRSQHFFVPNYLSFDQIDDFIAIVVIDGKERYFDPGQRFCAFGHLAWNHTFVDGLRQNEHGTTIASVPAQPYADSHISRIADLTLNEQGEATGTVTLSFTGDPALHWRRVAARGDDTSLNAALRSELEKMLQGGLEVRVTQVDGLSDPEKPLKVTYSLTGTIAAATSKRLLVPANIFAQKTAVLFNNPHRDLPLDFHFAYQTQDAVRFTFPAALTIESVPKPDKAELRNVGAFSSFSAVSGKSITLYRNVIVGRPLYSEHEYPVLRSLYGKLESGNQDTLVLTRAAAPATGN